MRVTRLEVFGFKSFMDRLVLPLEGGITGVVGPNGCGKSNIVDALRWVLGETRASNLRGGVLEDVIFNGTDKLRPLGLAEVSITMRATSEDFFADLVSPSLEADVIAELALKDAPLETVDVPSPELQREEGPLTNGRPQLTVIDGGKEQADMAGPSIGEASVGTGEGSVGPADVEEAENDAPFADPQMEGGEIAKTEESSEVKSATMLTRYSWLKSVNEVQVTRRLYRSGESEFFINRVACRLKDVKDFFRAIGLGARAYTIVAQGEVTRIVSAKPEDRRTILEEAAGVLGFRDKIAAATRRLDDTAVNVSRLEDIIKEVGRQVNSLRVQASRARNRQGLKEQITALEQAIFVDSYEEMKERAHASAARLEEAQASEAHFETRAQTAQLQEQEARAELMRIDIESDSVRSRIDNIREELNRRAQERSRRTSRLNELKAFGLARATEIRRLEERRDTLSQRTLECVREIEELQNQEKSLAEMANELGQSGEEDLKQAAARLGELRQELKRKELALRELRDRLISNQSSAAAIREQLIAASPLNQLKELTHSKDGTLLQAIAGDAKLFVEGLHVPDRYAKALQAVLAEKAEFIVSEDPNKIARYFVQNVLEQREMHGLGLGVLRAGPVSLQDDAPPDQLCTDNSGLIRLLDAIEVDPGCQRAAHHLLSRVYVAENSESALSLFESRMENGELASGYRDIIVVTLEGEIITSFSFYSLRHDGGLVQLKNKAEALEASILQLEAEQAQLHGEREALQGDVSLCEERQSEILRESQARQARARELSSAQGNVRGRLQGARRQIEQVEQDSSRLETQIQDANRKLVEYQEEEVQVQREIEELVPEDESDLHAELRILKDQYESHEEVRREGRAKLSHCADELGEARRAFDALRSKMSSCQLEVQKVVLEEANLRERVCSEYGEAFYHQITQGDGLRLDAATRESHRDEVLKLKARVQREGDVDPSAIERFEQESQRLQDLENQKRDLELAATTLRKTIARLTETSEKRFLATFHAVRSNFSRLMPKLFGGGKADLELLDPTHPLESGVEIIARPPGKKLKSIELMSGGEKALCATGLIFAMFIERPSPLCVLDEVDAPLDEANLVRFLNMVKEMSVKTQFLMITHNKRSMTSSDQLVGVTMPEPGASRMISVSLQEAYSQVA